MKIKIEDRNGVQQILFEKHGNTLFTKEAVKKIREVV